MPLYRFTVVVEAQDLEEAETALLNGTCWESGPDDDPTASIVNIEQVSP